MSSEDQTYDLIGNKQLEDDYYQLLLETVEKYDEMLPFVVQSGTTTVYKKMNVDILDLIRKKQEEIRELKVKLICLDDEYSKEVSRTPVVPIDQYKANISRVADFASGLVVSLHMNFAEVPDLMLLMQQIYLLRTVNDCP